MTTINHIMHLANVYAAAWHRDERMESPRTFKAPEAEQKLRAALEEYASQQDSDHDAARYRFLEEQCRTGSYRGIISRKAIDEAMGALAQPSQDYAAAEFASWQPASFGYRAFCNGCPFCVFGECSLQMALQQPRLVWDEL